MELYVKKSVSNFSCHYWNSVFFSPLAKTDFNHTPKFMIRKYSCVPLSLITTWWVDRPQHFEVNVFEILRNLCLNAFLNVFFGCGTAVCTNSVK